MSLATWLTVAAVCAVGAMSPGPSLAIVLRHALAGGRRNGSIAAAAHALGVGLYAWLCISGLAILVTASPVAFQAFQWAGAAYLAWLGFRGLTAKGITGERLPAAETSTNAARDGFLIVFLNPKIAIFFIALFSQIIGSDTAWWARLVYASTALLIDLAWYLLVAWLFTRQPWFGSLQRNTVWLERLFGVILLLLALKLVADVLGSAS